MSTCTHRQVRATRRSASSNERVCGGCAPSLGPQRRCEASSPAGSRLPSGSGSAVHAALPRAPLPAPVPPPPPRHRRRRRRRRRHRHVHELQERCRRGGGTPTALPGSCAPARTAPGRRAPAPHPTPRCHHLARYSAPQLGEIKPRTWHREAAVGTNETSKLGGTGRHASRRAPPPPRAPTASAMAASVSAAMPPPRCEQLLPLLLLLLLSALHLSTSTRTHASSVNPPMRHLHFMLIVRVS
jgi:hypothetical protein